VALAIHVVHCSASALSRDSPFKSCGVKIEQALTSRQPMIESWPQPPGSVFLATGPTVRSEFRLIISLNISKPGMESRRASAATIVGLRIAKKTLSALIRLKSTEDKEQYVQPPKR
jgi:hypothetical protein